MKLKKGAILELDITDIVFGGRGLAKLDGFAVFVDQAVPGDRVTARVFKKKKNYAEARVVSLLSASSDRISPPCRYSGYCGGCKWQFLAYEKQLEYKTRHVSESLEHIGGISDVTVLPAIASEAAFGYRNKMEFSCADRRWLLPSELGDARISMDFALGLHVPGTFHKVLDIDACLLQPDTGNAILRQVRDHMRESGMPPYGLRSHTGYWRFLMLRHSRAFDRWLVNIVTATENPKAVQCIADDLRSRFPMIEAVVNNITARKSGVAFGEKEVPLSPTSVLREKLGPFEFEISANSFFQTNTRGAETLYRQVAAYAELTGSETVMDLYSGIGTIPIWLSGNASEVVGLEIVESAVADAERNCLRNGIDNCRFVLGDIRESLAAFSPAAGGNIPDVMIIDPPRDGMHKDVVKQVLAMAPKRIVYVSCNPATLARDLGILRTAYEIDEVQPVDLFPHTYHIESVTKLHAIAK